MKLPSAFLGNQMVIIPVLQLLGTEGKANGLGRSLG